MRRILVLASAAAVAMLAFSPLAEAANTNSDSSSMGATAPHHATVKKTKAVKAKAKKPVHHKVAAKKVVKKKKPAVKTSAVAVPGIQA
jgi:hypothetical protein